MKKTVHLQSSVNQSLSFSRSAHFWQAQFALNFISQVFQRHPQRITSLIATFLLVGGGGAFAVASIAPDPSDLPVHQVIESIEPRVSIFEQAHALDLHSFSLFRSDQVRSNDTADSLLRRLGVNDAQASAFLRQNKLTQQHLLGRAGRLVSVKASDDQHLQKLSVRWINSPNDDVFQSLVIERINTETEAGTSVGFDVRLENAPLQVTNRLSSGVIQSSLFAATDDAAIPDVVATQLAEVFSGDIDFHRNLRKGDRFSVVYETLQTNDGEVLRSGRLLGAEFVNNGKTHQAVWFQDSAGKGNYYNLDGQSLQRSFLTSPVEFSRITSGFKMRLHPILNTWRAHLGTDYAAPTGTAVRTVGDGVVDFAGVQSGYGNVVVVKHANNRSTTYAHLSQIKVRTGQIVNQGDYIGAVGSTGWATGPHLHFEFKVNGIHQDPLTVIKQSESVLITAAARPRFENFASAMRIQLSSSTNTKYAVNSLMNY